MVGEIYLASIYFTDASMAKIRPVLLLKANSFSDIIYLPITSNLNTKGVQIDNNSLHEGYLPKPSIVVYEKPGVIAGSLLIKKIGVLNTEVYKQIVTALVHFIEN